MTTNLFLQRQCYGLYLNILFKKKILVLKGCECIFFMLTYWIYLNIESQF